MNPVQFGSDQRNTRRCAVDVGNLRVLVEPREAADNEAALELARLIGATGVTNTVLRETLRQTIKERDSARDIARKRAAQVADLKGEMRTRIFGEAGTVRMRNGRPCLMNKRESGWASFCIEYDSWDELFRRWAVTVTNHGIDEHGVYFEVRNMTAPGCEVSHAP